MCACVRVRVAPLGSAPLVALSRAAQQVNIFSDDLFLRPS